jgi:hypothetical protein
MNEYRSRVKLTVNLAKLKKSGMEPRKTQKAIFNFFIEKGFTYHRHLGFIYDRELTHDEWVKIGLELYDNGWFKSFNSFDTDVIGETKDITYLFREDAEKYVQDGEQ